MNPQPVPKRKRHKELVEKVQKRLEDLDKELEDATKAMDEGESDLADLAWESELEPEEEKT